MLRGFFNRSPGRAGPNPATVSHEGSHEVVSLLILRALHMRHWSILTSSHLVLRPWFGKEYLGV